MEQLVTGKVTERVIDDLEPVEVQEHDCQRADLSEFGSGCLPGDREFQEFGESRPVGQPRQGIVKSPVCE